MDPIHRRFRIYPGLHEGHFPFQLYFIVKINIGLHGVGYPRYLSDYMLPHARALKRAISEHKRYFTTIGYFINATGSWGESAELISTNPDTHPMRSHQVGQKRGRYSRRRYRSVQTLSVTSSNTSSQSIKSRTNAPLQLLAYLLAPAQAPGPTPSSERTLPNTPNCSGNSFEI